jgi:polyisoprenoid-binding protein YceI
MCGANASAKLSRSEFDLGKYVPFVGDEISLDIVIEASRE